MLTQDQQKILITMLYADVTRKNNRQYTSRAFYRTMKYLESNNLIKKVHGEGKSYTVELTIKGRFLARLLAGFKEVDPKIRDQYGAE